MGEFCWGPFAQGCGTSAGLIIAIGAQNAFVLKQGILKNHVFITSLICFIIDASLIAAGITGAGALITTSPLLLAITRWGGAVFLGYYGLCNFRTVFRPSILKLDASSERLNFKMTIVTALALSLLNPHVYLDTVVLLGSIGAQLPREERYFFALGAMFASLVWFFLLGYGAGYLGPLFQKPIAWKILDFIIGCVMWTIAILLLLWSPNCACPI